MFMRYGGGKGIRSWRLAWAGVLAFSALVSVALLSGQAFTPADAATRPAEASNASPETSGVLPCKRKLSLTAIYRVNGRIRFEGVADRSMRGKKVRVYEILSDDLVTTTKVRRDGTWWANSTTRGHRYTWLTKFVAEAGSAQTRWRRLGQAVAIRGRDPVSPRSRSRAGRTKIRLKVSGGTPDKLVIGIQTGCSRYEVDETQQIKTNRNGVASVSLPRPASGEPFAIFRVRTKDGFRISPPIVVKPGS